jgi:hypothetical protein
LRQAFQAEVQRAEQADMPAFYRRCFLALAGFAALYALFFFLFQQFPYVQSGANLVGDMKHRLAREGNAFTSKRGSRLHVMAFGYSKTLAGFIPAQFDEAMAAEGFPAIESYNFGLPGDSLFVADLETMAARGTAPDIALLTFPWPEKNPPAPGIFHFINDDRDVMEKLFPFRHLPRDALIMLVEAGSLRGMKGLYEASENSVKQVVADRGYYFIARGSHYPHDELPADFKAPYDVPTKIDPRPVGLGPVYQQLAGVLSAHGIKCIFVPKYYREGEYAVPAAINADTARIVAQTHDVFLEGPDYWLYPNRFFSDPVHANRKGAQVYTRQLAALMADWLRKHA